MPDFDYDLIDSIEQLQFYADRLHAEVALGRRFGFDIETGYEGEEREKAQLHPEEGLVAGISLGACEASGTVWGRYAVLCHDTGPNLDNQEAAEILWRLLITGHGVPHNASFEIRFLAVWFMAHLADHPELGPEVRRRLGYIPVYSDTMIEAFVEAKFKSSKHRSSDDGIGSEAALKPLTAETFGHAMTEIFELFETISGKEMTKKQKNSIRFNVLDLTGPHKRMIIDYVCEDAVWALAHHYKRYPDVQNSLIFNVEMAVVPCVVEMDAEGIVFDWQEMRETAVIAREFGDKLKDEILSDLTVMRNERGFTDGPCQINLGSVPQLSKVLYEDLGFPVKHKSRKTGKASTDKIAMKELSLQHDVVKKILTWRGLRKLVGTWLEEWPRAYTYAADGRAHPHFIQTAVSAGRFAATDPAIMTAPKEYHLELATGERFDFNFRDLVICPDGWYGLGWDYSQIELRVLAGEAGETVLAAAYTRGDDVHSLTASRMLGIPLDQVDPKTHRQTGKAQPLDSPVLTPSGWVRMGDLHPGDHVIGGDGLPVKVTGVFPQGVRQVYRVTTSDGATAECCDEHLWTVRNHNTKSVKWQTRTLRYLMDHGLRNTSSQPKYELPARPVIRYPSGLDLPLNPYVLGLLLGDGCFRQTVRLTSADSELIDAVRAEHERFRGRWRLILRQGHADLLLDSATPYDRSGNHIRRTLAELGLLGLKSDAKFIPGSYLKGTPEDRLALLQGLLDTDGNVLASGAEFKVCSEALARGVQELVRSLGGWASLRRKPGIRTAMHVKSDPLDVWKVYLRLPDGMCPFRLERKRQKWKPPRYQAHQRLFDVEEVRQAEVQCISVDSEDGLYVTSDYIVTHNTLNFALGL